MYSYGPLHRAEQKQDDQLEHTYSRYVRIRDVSLKTCQKRWMIGRSGERGSGISVLAAWHDDDDDSNASDSQAPPLKKIGLGVCCKSNLKNTFRSIIYTLRFDGTSWLIWLDFSGRLCNLVRVKVECYRSGCYVPLSGQTTTRNLYITIYIYFLDGRLCEVWAVRRGIRIVRRWGLNSSM